MPEVYIQVILAGIISFLVGRALDVFESKPKVCYWFPHQFYFDVKKENVVLKTDSITVQNLGRKSAEDIEIIHEQEPDYFKLQPSLSYTTANNANGEHVIKISSLGPKEFFTLQLLSYKTVPSLMSIRSKNGHAQNVPITIQRLYPQYINYSVAFLMIMGFATIVYLVTYLVRLAIL